MKYRNLNIPIIKPYSPQEEAKIIQRYLERRDKTGAQVFKMASEMARLAMQAREHMERRQRELEEQLRREREEKRKQAIAATRFEIYDMIIRTNAQGMQLNDFLNNYNQALSVYDDVIVKAEIAENYYNLLKNTIETQAQIQKQQEKISTKLSEAFLPKDTAQIPDEIYKKYIDILRNIRSGQISVAYTNMKRMADAFIDLMKESKADSNYLKKDTSAFTTSVPRDLTQVGPKGIREPYDTTQTASDDALRLMLINSIYGDTKDQNVINARLRDWKEYHNQIIRNLIELQRPEFNQFINLRIPEAPLPSYNNPFSSLPVGTEMQKINNLFK